MTRRYYAISGSFANAQIVHVSGSRRARDEWVGNQPDNSMQHSHYSHDAYACSRREADALCARNRVMARNHYNNSAYPECFGTRYLDAAVEIE